MILPALVDLKPREEMTGVIATSDATTVTEEAISKGTARADPEETIGPGTDIEMIEDGDQEAEIDHLADLPEMTLDLITEAESTVETTGTIEDMVTGTTIDAVIVTMTEEEGAIEDRITLATSLLEATTDLGLERPQDTSKETNLPRDLKDPDRTTGEIGPTKRAGILLFTTISCRIRTSSLRLGRHLSIKSILLSKTEKFMALKKFLRELKLQFSSKKSLLIQDLKPTRPNENKFAPITTTNL